MDATVGTSSLRRAAQVLELSPEVTIAALRGNVPTRLRRLREGSFDAILLAAAGVRRLELDLGGLDVLDLEPEVLLPAPGQGVLGIETRADDPAGRLLERLHDAEMARLVHAERRLLQLLGGGCHLPFGALATSNGGDLRLQAALGDVDEEVTRATVARVGAVAQSPDEAADACFAALRLALPNMDLP